MRCKRRNDGDLGRKQKKYFEREFELQDQMELIDQAT